MSYERNLCTVEECHVFRIGPRPSAVGYVYVVAFLISSVSSAERWHENEIWCGRCRVVEIGEQCFIRLEYPDNRLFAKCTVGENAVEKVIDSSRYFVLRIERGTKHAFIGIGFQERAEAFDFKDALERHHRSLDDDGAKEQLAAIPTRDYRMGDGDRIRVNFKVKTKDEVHEMTGLRATADSSVELGPPPSSTSGSGSSRRRRRRRKKGGRGTGESQRQPEQPQPQSQSQPEEASSGGALGGLDWGEDFGALETSGGSSGGGESSGGGGGGDVLLQF